MKIKILKSCSGNNFSYMQGDTVDADKVVAEDLVGCGFAEKIGATVKGDTKTKRDTKSEDGINADD